MGVSGFNSFLRRRYPGAYRVLTQEDLEANPVDHLYIDLASTLHQTVRRARTRAYFYFLLHKRLDAILACVKPRKRVVIALDGPAPLAKLLEQRRRRRREADRTARISRLSSDSSSGGAGGGGGGLVASPVPGLSSLMLTTGTPLMLEVHQSLSYYICSRLADPATEHLQFELSDSTVKGEGEVKILSRILQRAVEQEVEGGEGAEPESHMVLGGDSDLVVMAMVSGRRRLYICPDSQDFEEVLASWDGSEDESEDEAEGEGSIASAAAAKEAAAVAAGEAEVPGGLSVFCRDAIEQLWREEHLVGAGSSGSGGSSRSSGGSEAALQGEAGGPAASSSASSSGSGGHSRARAEVTGFALDLSLLAIMCGGNDYLPGMQSLHMECKHRPGIWPLYLEMRQEPEWRGRQLVQRRGQKRGVGGSVRINGPMLAELLQRYEDRRAQAMLLSESESESDDEGEEVTDEEEAAAAAAAVERLASRRRVRAAQRALGNLDPALRQPLTLRSDPEEVAAVIERLQALNDAAEAEAIGAEAAGECAHGAAPGSCQDPGCAGSEPSTLRLRKPSTRGDADAQEYLRGLEWVLRMYTRGHVEDYRWAYEGSPPTIADVLGVLRSPARDRNAATAEPAAAEAGASAAAELLPGAQEAAAAAAAALALLEEGAGVGTEKQQQQQQLGAASGSTQQRTMQPLLPATCALALLPGLGRQHAPTALQHLMDEGSPLADIYAVCADCIAVSRQIGLVSRDLQRLRQELDMLRRAYRRVWAAVGGTAGQEYPPPAFAPLSQVAEVLLDAGGELPCGGGASVERLQHDAAWLQEGIREREELESQLKAMMAALSRVQQAHHAAQHPYKPFPTADLEAAVAAVPLKDHPWRERRLLKFGRDLLFRRQQGGEGANSSGALDSLAAPASDAEQEGAEALAGGAEAAAAAAGAGVGAPEPRATSAAAASDAGAPNRASPWLQEAAAFAATYYRFLDRTALLGPRAAGILREALPISHTLRQLRPQRGRQQHEQQQLREQQGGRAGGANGSGSSGRGGAGKWPSRPSAAPGVPATGAGPGGPLASLQVQAPTQQIRQYSGAASYGEGVQQLLRQYSSRLLPAPRTQQLFFLRCWRQIRGVMLPR